MTILSVDWWLVLDVALGIMLASALVGLFHRIVERK